MPVEMQLNTLKLFTCLMQKGFKFLKKYYFFYSISFVFIFFFKENFFTEELLEQYEKLFKSKLSDTTTNEILKAYITSLVKMIEKKN